VRVARATLLLYDSCIVWPRRTDEAKPSFEGVLILTLHYSGDVLIHKIPMGEYGNNGYVIVSTNTRESIVIDTPGEPEKLIAIARDTIVRAILITHTHFDHLVGFDVIRSALGASVGVHLTEVQHLSSPPDFHIEDGYTLSAGTIKLKAIHTPGHTPGSMCFLVGKHLFSGDTLFPGGPGHTSTSENLRQSISSIAKRLLILPEGTIVCPGHGEDTTIGTANEEYTVFAGRSHDSDLCGDVRWLSN
jgi:hydroxyacylglutathione hydrolase